MIYILTNNTKFRLKWSIQFFGVSDKNVTAVITQPRQRRILLQRYIIESPGIPKNIVII